jgi:hypothetical protein
MKKCLRTILVFCLILALAVPALAARTTDDLDVTPIEESGETGRVSWEEGIVEAVGVGVPPANVKTPAQGKILARRAAIVDAYRNLTETVEGVQVNATTTMKDLQIADDTVKTKVSGLVKGAHIVKEQALPNGIYQVVISISLHGENSLGAVVLEAANTDLGQGQTKPAPKVKTENKQQVQGPVYTGVVIDARGLKLEATFSPVIFDENGRAVYGQQFVDANYAISQGMVEYANTKNMIKAVESGQSRAGKNPLIVKAIRKDNKVNVVISRADADKILAANEAGGFFKKCAVVFER